MRQCLRTSHFVAAIEVLLLRLGCYRHERRCEVESPFRSFRTFRETAVSPLQSTIHVRYPVRVDVDSHLVVWLVVGSAHSVSHTTRVRLGQYTIIPYETPTYFCLSFSSCGFLISALLLDAYLRLGSPLLLAKKKGTRRSSILSRRQASRPRPLSTRIYLYS